MNPFRDHLVDTWNTPSKLKTPTIPLRPQMLPIVVFSVIFVGYLFGQNLYAKWWIIDDHEIMLFLGKSDHLAITQLVPKLLQTEVGQFGVSPRFRPAYYVLRLLECVIWGKNPALWYAARLAIFAFFAVTIWRGMASWVGFIIAGCLTISIITFGFWSDIIARLGPSEIYAALGLAIFIVGFGAAYTEHTSWWGWPAVFLGTAIAVGSKENFILLVVPIGFLLARAIKGKRMQWSSWLFGALALLWCAWIATAVILGTRTTGQDIYGNSAGVMARLTVVSQALRAPFLLPIYLLASLFLLAYVGFRAKGSAMTQPSLTAFILTVLLVVFVVSQVAFYGGQWPTGTRYDFPGMLYRPLALLLVIWYLRKVSGLLPLTRFSSAALSASMSVLVLIALVSHIGDMLALRRASIDNVRRTKQFTAATSYLTGLAEQQPDYPLVFQSDDPWDYEPFYSYPEFLSADGVVNNKYLLWTGAAAEKGSTFDASLARRVSRFSQQGLPGFYLPIAGLQQYGSQCILVTLSGKPEWPCKIQMEANWRKY